MKLNTLKLFAIVFLMACALPIVFSSAKSSAAPDMDLDSDYPTSAPGDPVKLQKLYEKWEARYKENGGDENIVLPLKWSKGLSDEFTKASGVMKLNLISGRIDVETAGLPKDRAWDFWLVDDKPGEGGSVLPEPTDVMIRVGSLERKGNKALLKAELGAGAFADFEPDIFIVSEAGKGPAESRVLVAYMSLYLSLYRSAQKGQFGVIDGIPAIPPPPSTDRSFWTRFIDAVSPTASAQTRIDDSDEGIIAPIDNIIAFGKTLFTRETFAGNGRTCASCHPIANNFTIDPPFIATLGPSDPLFVAEFVPALAQLEKPLLMRQVGLILENVDGLENPTVKFVMRSVPHTLALPTSLTPDPAQIPHSNATGWSGDGAPFNEQFLLGDNSVHTATGDLLDFAIGAVRQHFPKTLNRIPSGGGVNGDFRFPTMAELIAMEAFQLSLGRQVDPVLPLNFTSPLVQAGQAGFMQVFGPPPSTRSCHRCHFNAGATFNDITNPNNPQNGKNRLFDTSVEDQPLQPGRLLDPTIPIDGGFGSTPGTQATGFGNQLFNATPVIEAADTGPFFHTNGVGTIEAAVQFYEFAFPNEFNPANGFTPAMSQAIAAFLRAINADENGRSATDYANRAKLQSVFKPAYELLVYAIADTQDAVEVLNGASLHPVSANLFNQAIALMVEAQGLVNQAARNAKIDAALLKIQQARALIVN